MNYVVERIRREAQLVAALQEFLALALIQIALFHRRTMKQAELHRFAPCIETKAQKQASEATETSHMPFAWISTSDIHSGTLQASTMRVKFEAAVELISPQSAILPDSAIF